MRRSRPLTVLLLLLGVLWSHARPAEAVPAWSRKYEVSCEQCHSAWPKLNQTGRDFKLRGYRLPGVDAEEAELGEFLTLERSFPVAARLVMRPFDKTRDGESRIRAFHEAELFVAGHVASDISVYGELEAEDEEGFEVLVEHGVVGWHPNLAANVVAGWAPPFWVDPFDTLADGGRRMTRAHKGPLDQQFSAGERLRSSSQSLSFFGSAADRLVFSAGISAGGGDPEGEDPKDGFGRLMVEAVPGVYVGGFFLGGTSQATGTALDFSRGGVDFQIEQGDFSAYGMILRATDDLLTGGNVSTTVGYLEGLYTFHPPMLPLIVPLARLDVLDDFTNLTANLSFYVRDNAKIYVEWWQNLDTPAGVRKDNRVTVQVDLAL